MLARTFPFLSYLATTPRAPVGELRHEDVAVARVDSEGVRLPARVRPPERAQVVTGHVVSTDLEVQVVADHHLVAHGVVLDAPGVNTGLAIAAYRPDDRGRRPRGFRRGGGGDRQRDRRHAKGQGADEETGEASAHDTSQVTVKFTNGLVVKLPAASSARTIRP